MSREEEIAKRVIDTVTRNRDRLRTRPVIVVLRSTFRGRTDLVGVFDDHADAVAAVEKVIQGKLQFTDGDVRAEAPPYDGWCDDYLFIPQRFNKIDESTITDYG